jgi:dTDP-4-dehydrorhamnose 3,5-epimerase
MKAETLAIPDVKVLMPKVFGDDRGYFMESYNKRVFDELCPGLTFVQDNVSRSADRYTVRGLHYQAPPFAQDKLVRVLKGRILDVAVDIRRGSPTYGEVVTQELSAENFKQMLVPKGFLHGFMTLEDDCLVAYKVTDYYDGASDGSVHWLSEELAIDWPYRGGDVVLSEKDKAAPSFGVFESPFVYEE